MSFAPQSRAPQPIHSGLLRLIIRRIRAQGDVGSFARHEFCAFGVDAMDDWIGQMTTVPYFCPPCEKNKGAGGRSATIVARAMSHRSKVAADWLRARLDTSPADVRPHIELAASHYDRIVELLQPAIADEGEESYKDVIGDLAKQKEHAARVLRPIRKELSAVADDLETALGLSAIPGDRVTHADGRVWIEGVPHESLVYGWDISLRGLQLLLRDRGEQISLGELSVLSGDAFHFCFADAKDTCPELLMPSDALANAAGALGYEYEWLITDSGGRAHMGEGVTVAERRELTFGTLAKMRSQIDAGRPVLVGGASHQGCGNWSLVVGYDEAGTELCHNGLDGELAGTWSKIRGLSLPISNEGGLAGYWNGRPRGNVVSGFSGGWLVNPVFILGDKVARPSARDSIKSALNRAVELHSAESVYYFGGQHYFGVEAYQRWAAALAETGGLSDLMLDEVVRGRSAAAIFCDKSAAQLPAVAIHLQKAAELYRAEVKVAQQAFGDFIPFRWDNARRKEWGSAEERGLAAIAVKEMLELENAAVAEISKALLAWTGSPAGGNGEPRKT